MIYKYKHTDVIHELFNVFCVIVTGLVMGRVVFDVVVWTVKGILSGVGL